MAKFYFLKDDEDQEYCYSLKYIKTHMKDNNLKEMTVFESKIIHNTGYFFCKAFNETGETGEGCGKKWCEKYIPNNGKSGRCKFYGYLYEAGKEKLLKL